MSNEFVPPRHLKLYCRFCKKTVDTVLQRGVSLTGTAVNRDSTFEYICTRCNRPHCYHGSDIISIQEALESDTRSYSISDRFLIGEEIIHPRFVSAGLVIGKETGSQSKLIVKFGKEIVRLVEMMAVPV